MKLQKMRLKILTLEFAVTVLITNIANKRVKWEGQEQPNSAFGSA